MFSFVSIASAQKAEIYGTFCSTDSLNQTECYSFNENGYFNYIHDLDSPPAVIGEGNFRIKNKKLILKFWEQKNYESGYYKILKNKTFKDSINIDFIIRGLGGLLIKNANISIRKNGYSISHFSGNDKGQASLKFKKLDSLLNLSVRNFTVFNQDIQIDLNYDQTIEVFLSPINQRIPVGEEVTAFEIIEKTSESLILKDGSGQISKFKRSK